MINNIINPFTELITHLEKEHRKSIHRRDSLKIKNTAIG